MAVSMDAAAVTQAVPLSELRPAPWNPRILHDSRFRQLCASLEADPAFLWERPVLAQADGTIYAGNMRYRAAEYLGWATIPARRGEVSDQYAKERALRDNNTFGEWQEQELAELLVELQGQGTALDLLGFPDDELTRLLDSVGALGDTPTPEAQIDRAAELQAQWGTALGQLWVIPSATVPGEAHRLLCGDSTDAATVARLMDGRRAEVLLTDPPYNVGLEYGESTDDNRSDFVEWCGQWYAAARPYADRAVMTVGSLNLRQWLARLPVWHMGVWVKGAGATSQSRATQFCGWEPILFDGERWPRSRHLDVFEYAQGIGIASGHPCPKPLALWADLCEHTTGRGAIVLDVFTGGGSTHAAAEQTGRLCYGLEIEPQYVAVALQRLADMGLRPERADG